MEPNKGPDVLFLVHGIPATLSRLLVLPDLAPKLPAWLHPHGLSTQDLIDLALREALEQADYQTDAWPCSCSSAGWDLQGLWNGSSTGRRVPHGTLTSVLQVWDSIQSDSGKAKCVLPTEDCEQEQPKNNEVQLLPGGGCSYKLGTALDEGVGLGGISDVSNVEKTTTMDPKGQVSEVVSSALYWRWVLFKSYNLEPRTRSFVL
ncbi:hypothetical protein HPG69_014981 [Diceros bicornis minor]|uniref:Uncharacterized protein n=1 Tax=Diceros bicornis minor TaxID=77932 RepID=A0A7J7FL14_DICBM|nr:hypothetical protein HPG69_014981 [Diceros bicornis minor]